MLNQKDAVRLFWTLGGNVVYAASSWGVLMVFARLSSAEDLGRFSYALALTAPIFFLSSLQLRNLQAADVRSQFAFADLIFLRIVTSVGAILLSLVLACWLAREGVMAVVCFIALAKAADLWATLMMGYYHRQGRLKVVGIGLSINGISTFTAVWVSLAFVRPDALSGAAGYFIGSCAAAACVWIWALTAHRQEGGSLAKFRPRMNLPRAWQIARPAFSFSLAGALSSANVTVVRHVIASRVGMDVLGAFSALSYLMTPASMLANALGQAATPPLALLVESEQKARFKRRSLELVGLVLAVCTVLVVLSAFWGEDLVGILYGDDFRAYGGALVYVMLAAGALGVASIITYVLLASKLYASQLHSAVAGFCSAGLSAYVLVPRTPIVGGAVALLVGYLAQAVVNMWILRRAEQQASSARGEAVR